MGETKDSTRRLHHTVPPWVSDSSTYHIRMQVERSAIKPLIDPPVATALLRSAALCHAQGTWFCHLMVLSRITFTRCCASRAASR
jgi:hypothetical protein